MRNRLGDHHLLVGIVDAHNVAGEEAVAHESVESWWHGHLPDF